MWRMLQQQCWCRCRKAKGNQGKPGRQPTRKAGNQEGSQPGKKTRWQSGQQQDSAQRNGRLAVLLRVCSCMELKNSGSWLTMNPWNKDQTEILIQNSMYIQIEWNKREHTDKTFENVQKLKSIYLMITDEEGVLVWMSGGSRVQSVSDPNRSPFHSFYTSSQMVMVAKYFLCGWMNTSTMLTTHHKPIARQRW